MSNYIDYMANFSQSDLRGYLGEDMVDLLVEWMPNGDTLLTKQIMNLFKPCVETLFSYELPDEFELKKGEYFSFLDETFDGNKVKMKEIFSSSNCYLWLIDTLKNNNGCMYFGKLSESLHIAVVSDPKPYRKDIKIMLMNLLKLIKKLEIEEIIIDRPNYSQRIRLKEI